MRIPEFSNALGNVIVNVDGVVITIPAGNVENDRIAQNRICGDQVAHLVSD